VSAPSTTSLAAEKVNLAEKLRRFSDHWSPKIVGELNDSYVKLVKIAGEFIWHHHDTEDEMFLVISGRLTMHFRDRAVDVRPGEFIIVPRGVEHMPASDGETEILLFEPKTVLNTGDLVNDRTVAELERI
jgi:mannose-6-phosphate isomerase-like protein (cupin superfamily)